MPSTTLKLRPIFHVTPQNDLYKHVLDASGTCWCCPYRDDEDPDEITFVHFAYDCREQYEDGIRKPH